MYLQLQNVGWDSIVTYVHYKYTFITNIHNFTITQYKTVSILYTIQITGSITISWDSNMHC